MAQQLTTSTRTLPELVAAARDGDQDAFRTLFSQYQLYAWSVALRTTRNRSVAEEAVIDGFAKALGSLDRLREPLKFPGYLGSCVRNEVLMAVRRSKSLVQVDSLEDQASKELTPEGVLDASEDAQRAFAAFERLDDRQQRVILLVDVEGVPASAAATTLGVTTNTLYQMLFRARKALRLRFIAPALEDGSPPSCRACNEKLGEYANGTASSRTAAVVEEHLRSCADCQSRLAEAHEVCSLLTTARGVIPVGVGASMAGRFALMHGKSLRARRFHFRAQSARTLALAAAAAFVLTGSVASGVLLTSDDHPTSKLATKGTSPHVHQPSSTPANSAPHPSRPSTPPAAAVTTTTLAPPPSASRATPVPPSIVVLLKPLVLSSTLAMNGTGYVASLLEGSALSASITATNPNAGGPVPALRVVGTLPTGLSFVAAGGTGTFTGTADSSGSYVMTVTASLTTGAAVSAPVVITVNAAPTFTSSFSITGSVGTPLDVPVTASGYPAPKLTASGDLPPGLQFVEHGSVATIQGTPLDATTTPDFITVVATNSVGSTQQIIEISINP